MRELDVRAVCSARIIPGRTSPEEITLFKSNGLAIQDSSSAHAVYERAKAKGVGLEVDFSGASLTPSGAPA